jgi:UDP-GlcNAc:undecaprenyl-phosphate/decaprenyl-phosphate GlcNAc-1-phosphate transferase
MDGINGITGGYSLILIVTLIYINNFRFYFINNDFLILFMLTILIFNYFNFRSKAVCFAGDVGSLTIAYIVIYLVIKLCLDSGLLIFILLLTLYGIDTIFTIIQRIIRRENIFDAHRLHLFQVAVNKTKMPHLKMSLIYMVVQLLINIMIIVFSYKSGATQLFYVGILLLSISVSYILIKKKMMPDLP